MSLQIYDCNFFSVTQETRMRYYKCQTVPVLFHLLVHYDANKTKVLITRQSLITVFVYLF